MYTWDNDTGKFVDDNGIPLSNSEIIAMLERSIASSMERIQEIALSGGRGLYERMQQIIKDEYIRQYMTGIGGRERMTPADWGRIGNMLREQYNYLRPFVDQITRGLLSDAEIANRARMYVNSAREAFQRAMGQVIKKLGFDLVMWVMTGGAEHCPTCEERQSQGWKSIGPRGGFPTEQGESFPGDGSTICLTNDQCTLSYMNSKTGATYPT